MTSVPADREESSFVRSLLRRSGDTGSWFSPTRLAAVVLVIGLVFTVSLALTAAALDRHNERGLLEGQTQQAAAVTGAAVLGISGPLTAALDIAQATDGDPDQFMTYMTGLTGPGHVFASATLWDTHGATPKVVAQVGTPELAAGSSDALDFVALAQGSPTFVVTSPGKGEVDRVAYAVGDPADPGYVVHAERAIPPSRVVPVQSNPAFAGLNFATYLGATTDTSALATTNIPMADLPLTGDLAQTSIPFGDTSITLVTSARGHLGGELGRWLPWVVLVGGTALTLFTAYAAAQLVRRRRRAETDSSTIAGLYEQLDGLYGEQRSISETLQRALLPAYNPSLPNVTVASRYVAGAQGVDIGGDWYSMIRLDEDRFAFVVGDVSGRGISAATLMARLRFTMRAYLLEGHAPGVVLEMCSRQIDIREDQHFATVLVGVGNLNTRELVLANAGHFEPLVLSGGQAHYAATIPGPALGISSGAYASTTTVMPAGSTLLAFTDGLIERRREDIDVGLARLSKAAIGTDQSVDDLVARLVDELLPEGGEDDVALLAFQWGDGPRETEGSDDEQDVLQVTTRVGHTA